MLGAVSLTWPIVGPVSYGTLPVLSSELNLTPCIYSRASGNWEETQAFTELVWSRSQFYAAIYFVQRVCRMQVYSSSLGQVVDIVVSHQGLPFKVALVSQLMSALVLPAPEHYRPLLRRFAALGTSSLQVSDCTPTVVSPIDNTFK
jgi:hypothetical protein